MKITMVPLAELPGAPGVDMAFLFPGDRQEHVRVDVAVLKEGASLPRHRAGRHQFFYVLSGHGRVAGADDSAAPVGPGALVEWQAGEDHTSWADSEMTVLIIQRHA